jgi:hypothetical protein
LQLLAPFLFHDENLSVFPSGFFLRSLLDHAVRDSPFIRAIDGSREQAGAGTI